MIKKIIFTLAFLSFLYGCSYRHPNSELPAPVPEPVVEEVVEPPEPEFPRLHTRFDWNLARGFTLFAGTRANEAQIREVYQAFSDKWPHLRLVARVCAEVQSWPGDRPWLPTGVTAKPFNATAPAYKELKNFLDVAVTIPRAHVLVVPVCNLKEDGTTQDNIEKWVRATCKLTASYPNTAVEVINEAQHPRSSFRDNNPSVHRMLRACRAAARNGGREEMQIGTDSNVHHGNTEYRYRRSLVDYYSYHPWRNPDPTKEELREIVRENDGIGRTVFSETTALDVENYAEGNGLVTTSIEQIMDYARGVEKSGAVFVYHNVWGLGWPVVPIGDIIERGDWEIRHGR